MVQPEPWDEGRAPPGVLAQAFGRVPPTALLLLAILSIQLSSALATKLFADLGPSGTVFLSTAFAVLLLAVFSCPKIDRAGSARAPWPILLFGLADAATALCFFRALQYIPLGIAAAISFLGPLGLAVATSRRPLAFPLRRRRRARHRPADAGDRQRSRSSRPGPCRFGALGLGGLRPVEQAAGQDLRWP